MDCDVIFDGFFKIFLKVYNNVKKLLGFEYGCYVIEFFWVWMFFIGFDVYVYIIYRILFFNGGLRYLF